MSSVLRCHAPSLVPGSVILGAFVVAAIAPGCSCDSVTNQPGPTTTSTDSGTGAGGGTGGTTTSSGGTGGTGALGGGGFGAGGGGTGGGGTGGTGGTPPSCIPVANNGEATCPGATVVVDDSTNGNLCFTGDTSVGSDAFAGKYCGSTGSTGPERLYYLDVQSSGTLKVRVHTIGASTLDPTLYRRQDGDCAAGANFFGCWAFFATHEEFGMHTDPAKYTLFVDGANGTSGEFQLDISLAPPACGDGIINPGEECDDANKIDSDGCTSQCKFQLVTLFDKCFGEVVQLMPNQPQVFVGNTTPYADDYIASKGDKCGAVPGTGGKDRVYEVLAGASGMITASVGYDIGGTVDICNTKGLLDPGCWDRVLYVVGPNYCDDGQGKLGPQIACSDVDAYVPEVVTFPVEKGKKYYVIVDGYYSDEKSYGTYNLHLVLTPP